MAQLVVLNEDILLTRNFNCFCSQKQQGAGIDAGPLLFQMKMCLLLAVS